MPWLCGGSLLSETMGWYFKSVAENKPFISLKAQIEVV